MYCLVCFNWSRIQLVSHLQVIYTVEEFQGICDRRQPSAGSPLHHRCPPRHYAKDVLWPALPSVRDSRDLAGPCSCNCTGKGPEKWSSFSFLISVSYRLSLNLLLLPPPYTLSLSAIQSSSPTTTIHLILICYLLLSPFSQSSSPTLRPLSPYPCLLSSFSFLLLPLFFLLPLHFLTFCISSLLRTCVCLP